MATLGKKLPELAKATTPGEADTAVYAVQSSSDRRLIVGEHIPGLDANKKIPDAFLKLSAWIIANLGAAADAAAARTALGIGEAGTRSDNYFATSAQGGLAASAVQPAELATALANYVTSGAMTSALAAKIGTGAEAITAIEAVTDGAVLGAFADHILAGSTALPTIATFQDWRDQEGDIKTLGLSFWAPLLTRQAMTFGATVVIDYGDAAGEDIDAGMCRSLYPAIAATGDTVASFKGATGLMVDRTVELLFTNSGGGARAVSIATGAGITITHAAGVINPGLGSTADDWLKAWVWLKSTTEAVVLGYAAKG